MKKTFTCGMKPESAFAARRSDNYTEMLCISGTMCRNSNALQQWNYQYGILTNRSTIQIFKWPE